MFSTASLAIIVMIAFTAKARLIPVDKSSVLPASTLPAEPTLPSQPHSVPAQQLQVERITVTPTGFNPDKITRPRGQVMWAIDNRSGLDEVWLRIDRLGGERVIDVRVDRRKLDWRKELDLRAGRYKLTEVRHPDWVCLITISE